MIFIADDQELIFYKLDENWGFANPIMEIVATDQGHRVRLKVFSGSRTVFEGTVDECRQYARRSLGLELVSPSARRFT